MLNFENISFNDVPAALSALYEKLNKIEDLVRKSGIKAVEDTNRSTNWLSVEDLQNYLPGKPAKQTIYGWVNKKTIPYHKTGKKLSFNRNDIDKWLSENKRQTLEELSEEVHRFLGTSIVKK